MSINTLVNKQRSAQILLVEDNRGDVLLTRRAFKDAKIDNQLTVASTGEEALAILRKEGVHADSRMPDIILLDINLPQMSGKEVLREIKQDDKLKRIPVIVLSSSRAESDVIKSYELHANGYITKPVKLNELSEAIQNLEQFWFKLVVMPDPADVQSE